MRNIKESFTTGTKKVQKRYKKGTKEVHKRYIKGTKVFFLTKWSQIIEERNKQIELIILMKKRCGKNGIAVFGMI